MPIEIRQVGPEALAAYERIPIRFRVESVLRVEEIDGGVGGLRLREEKLDQPYVKDYDTYEDQLPTRWPGRFDVSRWLFLMAFDGDRPVGGAVVAYRSPDVDILEGRTDLAVLWDIRVHPDCRRQGIGTRLLRRAAEWARRRKCRQLKIETQSVNVAACRFYAAQGCRLRAIDRHGYARDPRIAHESMLLWYLDL